MAQPRSERRFSKLAAAINQKAARLGQYERLTATDLAAVFLEADRLCSYCGVGLSWEGVSFDHIVPFSKGGRNVVVNLAACCITCQRSKFTKTPTEHAAARRLIVKCPVDGVEFRPRWADYQRGLGRTCSRKCSGKLGGEAPRVTKAS